MNIPWFWYGLAFAITIIDQIVKQIVNTRLQYGERVEVLAVLDLTLVYNPGAAFSFLSDAGGWQRWFFSIVAVVVSIILVIWIYRLPRADKWLAVSLALILGGAVGNLADRMYYGYVIDFILAHYAGHHFPAFNIADSAITIGAIMMVLDAFRKERGSSR